MANVFVFTAGSREAREHLTKSIEHSIPVETVLEAFPAETQAELVALQRKASGFFAWGAVPGPQNEARWNRMVPGDYVLCVYDNRYRFVSRILAKYRNATLARSVWGSDSDGKTWEYLYFLTPPTPVDRAVGDLREELNDGYQGFTRIGDERIARLVGRYGSLEQFVVDCLGVGVSPAYLLLRQNVESKWQDKEGSSYHYSSRVPNHTKLVEGAEVVLDRRFPDSTRVIGRAKIGAVTPETGPDAGTRYFRASFVDYQDLRPPRLVTPEIKANLEKLPGYNQQHSIRVLPRDVFEHLSQAARAWIFQGNPNGYDIRAAVKTLRSEAWTVTGYRDEIGPGDRVYLWESGPDGGIVALAEVVDRPSVRPLLEASRPFVKDARFEDEHQRVGLSIVHALDPILPRSVLKRLPVLADLSIFRFAQATNFPVTSKEAEVIEELITKHIAPGRSVDLRSDDVLRRLYTEFRADGAYVDWHEDLAPFLDWVAKADPKTRGTREFQSRLWDDNPVSSPGRAGSISVGGALAEDLFRDWLATLAIQPGPDSALSQLEEFYETLIERLRPHCPRMPHVKIFRVLAALFPTKFTVVVDRGRLKDLYSAMFGEEGRSPVARHANIVERLQQVLGPLPSDVSELAWRMMFPWYLYVRALDAGVQAEPREDRLADLADKILWDREELARITELLEARRQVIFYGPPGTGKTYVARELGVLYATTLDGIEKVQFHASYSYEDFVEGYRPSGTGNFSIVAGPLKRIAQQARENPEGTYVLVIDELNRANVAKVFGELYYLLEYRDEEIDLQYSQEPFSLPKNLWIIATMNTADRSIALVDAALRRRFYFVPFFPDQAPIKGLLHRWLERNKPDLAWLAALVDRANELLGDRHVAIGPSYFMTDKLDERWIGLIWSHAILPYLEEHFFGEPDRLQEFGLEMLRKGRGASSLGE